MTNFELGLIGATPGAVKALADESRKVLPKGDTADDGALAAYPIKLLLQRHASGDWGDLGTEDKLRNLKALVEGSRLFSAYQVTPTLKVYVITESDRSTTTVLLRDEY